MFAMTRKSAAASMTRQSIRLRQEAYDALLSGNARNQLLGVGIGPCARAYQSTWPNSCSSSATTADGSRRIINSFGGLRVMMRGFVASGARQMTVQQVASTSLARRPRHPQPDSLRMLGASQSSRPSPSWTSGSSASGRPLRLRWLPGTPNVSIGPRSAGIGRFARRHM